MANKRKLTRNANDKFVPKVGNSLASVNPSAEVNDNEVVPDKLLKHCKRIVVRVRKVYLCKDKSNEKELKETSLLDKADTKNQKKENSVAEEMQSVKEDDATKSIKSGDKVATKTKDAAAKMSRITRKTVCGRKIKSRIVNGSIYKPAIADSSRKENVPSNRRVSLRKFDEMYNFSAQSSNSIEIEDPAADIIQKLIKEKKVKVVKNSNNNKPRQNKAKTTNFYKVIQNPKAKSSNNPNPNADSSKVIVLKDMRTGNNKPQSTGEQIPERKIPRKPSTMDNFGSFSRLAQSVLLRKTDKNGKVGSVKKPSTRNKQRAKELLKKVGKIVSTPKKDGLNGSSLCENSIDGNLSPISICSVESDDRNVSDLNISRNCEMAVLKNQSSVCEKDDLMKKPWRMSYENLPNTYNFTRNSRGLPSYSSDFLLATPRKTVSVPSKNSLSSYIYEDTSAPPLDSENMGGDLNSTNNDKHVTLGEDLVNEPDTENCSALSSSHHHQDTLNDSDTENTPPSIDQQQDSRNKSEANIHLSLAYKQCSQENHDDPLNDSDAENIPPISTNFDEEMRPNRSKFGGKCSTPRMPLRTLNEMEVMNLSAWKPPVTPTSCNRISSTNINRRIKLSRRNRDLRNFRHSSRSRTPPYKLFGFEDYLQCGNEENSDNRRSLMKSPLQLNYYMEDQSKNEKLSALRKWRPTDLIINNERINKESNEKNIVQDLFQPHHAHKMDPRQLNIKNMLCSTMISGKDHCKDICRDNTKEISALLFKDNEVQEEECSINEKEINRTYEKPYKRKRRIYEQKYVIMVDSDASSDENDSPKKKSKEQSLDDSFELDNEKQVKRAYSKPKRRRKEAGNPQLERFVKDFNEMCQDVENYELQIE